MMQGAQGCVQGAQGGGEGQALRGAHAHQHDDRGSEACQPASLLQPACYSQPVTASSLLPA